MSHRVDYNIKANPESDDDLSKFTTDIHSDEESNIDNPRLILKNHSRCSEPTPSIYHLFTIPSISISKAKLEIAPIDANIRVPIIDRNTPDEVDEHAQWNSPPQEPYPLPDPSDPAFDFPSVAYIDGYLEKQFDSLMHEFPSVFATALPSEGANLPPFEIHLKTDAIFRRRPVRRFSALVSEVIKEKIDELLRLGIIVHTLAQHAADLVVVNQKGKWRMCVNYCELNSVTVPFSYPIPNLKDLLLFLKGKKIFSVLDNKLGYHQLNVEKQCQHLLAFQSQFGSFTFMRCPFGPSMLPAWYNFLMQTIVFTGLLYVVAVCYFDDAVVASDTYEQHLQDLRVVMERYKAHNLILRGTKCQIALAKVTFHGFIVSGQTVAHDPARQTTIFNIPIPVRPKQLQRFLGMVNYFSAYIPNYSIIRAPLNPMLNAKKLVWTTDTTAAFHSLKNAVRACTALYHIDYKLKIVLDVDASKLGIGGYLFQINSANPESDMNDKSLQQPLEFISHAFSEAQQKWQVQEQEAYALSYCILALSHLLLGAHFHVRTDHMNLTKMFESKSVLVQRSLLKVQPFDFTLGWIKGSSNVIPDDWSRLHMLNHIESFPLLPIFDAQAEDQDFIVVQAESQELVVNSEPIPIAIPNIVLPEINPERLEVLRQAHYGTGHRGIQQTLQYLKDNNRYWDTMRRDLIAFTSTCPICQLTWRIPRGLKLLRRTFESYEPFYSIAIDYQGPFQEDANGHQYFFNVVDVFSRYIRIFPTKDKTALSAALCLLDIYSQHSLVRIIASDFAQSFVADIYKRFLFLITAKPSYSLPYRHQTSIERPQREVLRHARVVKLTRPDDSDHLMVIQALISQKIINNCIHKDINCSPHELLYGIHHSFDCFPIETVADELIDPTEFMPDEPRRAGPDIISSMISLQIELQDRSRVFQAKHTDRFLSPNLTSQYEMFTPGQYVTIAYPENVIADHKDDPPRKGPFRILSRHRDTYIYWDSVERTEHSMHASRLGLYNHAPYHPIGPEEMARRNANVFEVSAILGHDGDPTSRRTLRFYVSYTGYDDTYNGYITALEASRLALMEGYLATHPELRRIMRYH